MAVYERKSACTQTYGKYFHISTHNKHLCTQCIVNVALSEINYSTAWGVNESQRGHLLTPTHVNCTDTLKLQQTGESKHARIHTLLHTNVCIHPTNTPPPSLRIHIHTNTYYSKYVCNSPPPPHISLSLSYTHKHIHIVYTHRYSHTVTPDSTAGTSLISVPSSMLLELNVPDTSSLYWVRERERERERERRERERIIKPHHGYLEKS